MNVNKIKSGTDILELKLGELYDIEKQVEKALGKIIRKTTAEDLKEGFEHHLSETQTQITRLESAFEILEVKPHKVKSEGIRGIVSDEEAFLFADISSEIKDILLATGARKVEHYETACYASALELARLLGHPDIERLLRDSCVEEEATDDRLAEIVQKLSEALLQGGEEVTAG